MVKNILNILLLMLGLAHTLQAQERTEQGVLHYKIDYPTMLPEMKALVGALPTEMKASFRYHMLCSETQTKETYSRTVVNARNHDLMIMFSLNGKKMLIRKTEEQMRQESPKVYVELKNEQKEIAGYLCKKALVTFLYNDNHTDTVTVFYCESLGPAEFQYEFLFKGIKGMLMEYSLVQEGIEMHYVVTRVEKKEIPASYFEAQPGYTPISDRELQRMMEGY